MPDKPLLLLPSPVRVKKPNGRRGGARIHGPDRATQAQRIAPQLTVLQQAFQNKSVLLADNPGSEPPELLLVIETVGPVKEFFRAVSLIPGLLWQIEWDEEFDPDADFYIEKYPAKKLPGFAYLMLGNQQAMRQIESLWRKWQSTGSVPHSFGPWKDAFRLLKTIRPWNEEDRIRGTGLDEYAKELEARGPVVPCELELWFRDKPADRSAAEQRIRRHVSQAGGQVVSSFSHDGICYHGMLIEVPSSAVQQLVAMQQDITLLKSDDVFVIRPAGQSLAPMRHPMEENETIDVPASDGPLPSRPPIAALLDGLPLQNHQLIRDRLIVVNPEAEYAAARREHGTQMASVIIRGDVSKDEPPLLRPLVVRPILVADPNPELSESMPSNRLVIDIVHQAVRELVAGDAPQAPTIRVVNFSITDRYAQFDRTVSSWARMLDWLANEHNLLFVASAGNHREGFSTNIAPADWPGLPPERRQDTLLQTYADDARNRRLRPPAEAMNALTVGAIADDGSTLGSLGRTFLPYSSTELPAHYSAMGLGPRRTIKPEIFVPGGRLPVSERLVHPANGIAFDDHLLQRRAAGIQVATPTENGRLDQTIFQRGTSHAAALTTRNAVLLWDVLEELQSEQPLRLLPEFFPVLLKTLLVHGASWNFAREELERALGDGLTGEQFRKRVQRILGYGRPDFSRCAECTAQRATMLGWGSLSRDQGHLFQIPLPRSLSGVIGLRRVTVTLAYLSPISVRSQKHIAADLRFNLTAEESKLLQVSRTHCDSDAVVRGTVQHEVFEGQKTAVFDETRMLNLRISASEQASGFVNPIRYGFAVSLEVGEGVPVPVYEEVALQVRSRLGSTPT